MKVKKTLSELATIFLLSGLNVVLFVFVYIVFYIISWNKVDPILFLRTVYGMIEYALLSLTLIIGGALLMFTSDKKQIDR